MALFNKKQKEARPRQAEGEAGEKNEAPVKSEVSISSSFTPVQESVITGFYISEKAGLLNGFNQYVFKVSDTANKSELSKQVEKMFNVKVKSVKVLNTQKKRRDVGKYHGFKPGFKKAVVVLKKGYAIEQAKA